MTKGTIKKLILIVVKLVLVLALLGWVCTKVHWHDYSENGKTQIGIATALAEMNKAMAVGAVVGLMASLAVIAVRWWYLLRIQAIHISLWEAVRLTFLGQFFNAVIPGTVGGDLIKAYYVSKHTPQKAAVLVATFVDRVMGLTELTLLSAIMVVIVWTFDLPRPANFHQAVIAVAIVLAVVTMTFVFLLSTRFRKALRLQKFYQRLSIAHHIESAGDAARVYRHHIGALVNMIVVTFGAHVLWIFGIAMIGFALSLDTKWYSYFLNIPLIYIIGSGIPTPGGVGGIEALFLKAFSNVNASQVIVLAVLARLMQVVCGLPGMIVAITGPRLPKKDVIQAELGEASADGKSRGDSAQVCG